MRLIKPMRQLLFALGLTWIAASASAQTIQIEDTFSRSDGTDLGTTEVGGVSYFESGNFNLATVDEDSAELFGNELIVFGVEGFFGSGPGVANLNTNLADMNISATMRYEGLFLGANTQSFAGGGFVLRRTGEEDAVPQRSEGLVELYLLPSGGLFLRETHNGALNQLYGFTDPNPFGMGGSNTATYSAPGQLPTTFNGLPFDANGNGVLENDEPFQLGANLVGNSLDVLVNGQTLLSRTLSRSEPVNFQSTPGLIKNRFLAAGAANADLANVAFDNLVISGTPYDVPRIVHRDDMNPAAEKWHPAVGAAGVTNNGAVDDGGVPAWNIEDASTAAGSASNWQYTPSQDQLAAIPTEGWRMNATIRVLGANDTPDGAIEISVFPNSDLGYTLWLGSDASGNALAAEFVGTIGGETGPALGRTATVAGSGYHDYEMVFDPLTETVDVFADDTLIIDDMQPLDRGDFPALNRILWGANSSTGTGNANYSFVEFTVGDEPPGLDGDFDGDSDVDGADFLAWQRGESPDPVSAADLADWKANFGAAAAVAATTQAAAAVPEPACAWLLATGLLAVAARGARKQL